MNKTMAIKFLIMFTVMLTVIFLAHYFLYKSHIKFLDIQSMRYKRAIIVFYVGMFVLLFFSMFAVRTWNNKMVDLIYFTSTLWLGILTYLFIFNLVNWLLVYGFKVFHFNANFKIIHLVFLGFTVIVTILGVINYYNIRNTKITVEIENLPKSWENKKVILVSDIHVGSFRNEAFVKNIVTKINNKNADIVIICGDLFDGTKLDVDKISAELSKLHANEKIYFVFGNHDLYSKTEDVYAILNKTNFHILDNASIIHDSVEIVGINHKSLHDASVFSALKSEYKKNYPIIFLSHEPVRNIQQLIDLEIDLQLSGHTHGGQFAPFNFITTSMYGEMNYGLHDFGEFKSFTSSGLGAWGPAFRIFSRSEIVEIKFVNLEK